MEIHDVIQGSPEWLDLRSKFDTASEAPVVMGASKYMTRAELLRQKATGYAPAVDGAKQALFDRGHETEALARTLVEELIGEELYPITGSRGRLLASFDGLTVDPETMDPGKIGYEHKLWNESLAAQVRAGELEPHYYWQLEHQILVGELDVVIFVCSDGTSANFVHMEYRAVPGRAEQLLAGWTQFHEDLANYQHVEVLPAVVATEQPSLPAVVVTMGGSLTVRDNLPEFSVALREYIKSIPGKPSTDQEFADCEAACKNLKKAEEALQQAEDNALAGMTDVESMRRVVAELRALARATRLAAEKTVESRKIAIRDEIRVEFSKQAASHLDSLNAAIGKPYMPAIPVDFAAAMKGKKTVISLRDACSQALANFKISASAIAVGIQNNMQYAQVNAADYGFLFADFKTVVLKAPDDFQALVTSRIATHKAEEARKDQERKDREAREAQEREARNAAAQVLATTPETTPAAHGDVAPAASTFTQSMQPRMSVGVGASGSFATRPAQQAVQPETYPSMALGHIATRLGFQVTGAFLRQLGFEPAAQVKSASLYHESDFPAICRALIEHIESVAEMAPA